ncbi:EPT/RTPC-like protein [Cucurbitaria berberidis CBS 394.84]|uniref:EPT/RTPC-like protein n=1 Tax=Cucurbitaria berberidis CBS 394.84 TaxID=1168544 RepID=A0A9P4LBJ9_9PLEO|nr:EPT/RTPC-like protein [Cucurbitaria berberidis CBS 394.84]KAF1848618.1 EPT/RTPC-like protein [Cucurbitaria berberidis CBS 394.84]
MAPKSPETPPIHLEGTTLEGGGQLLRLALGLASLTKKPIHLTNIRGKRFGGGGLKSQHLTCVQWLGNACNARISGVGLKSKEVTFVPGGEGTSITNQLEVGDVRINQNTPGSINLILQAILPYLLFSGAKEKIRVRITGGSNVSNSPSYEYIVQVLIPMLELIGMPPIEAQLHSRGWSQGTTSLGSITYIVTPLTTRLPAFQLAERGSIRHVKATILAPKDTEQHFRDELDVMFERRESRIFGASIKDAQIEIIFEDSHHDKRYYLLLVATTTTGVKLGRDWLYDQGVRPGKLEKIIPAMVKKVSDDLLAEIEHGGCVDEYLRDQMVVFQALSAGKSQVYGGKRNDVLLEQSLHAKTAQWVAQRIVGVDFDEQGGCEGIGFYPGGVEEEGQKDKDLAKSMVKLELTES